MCLDTSLVLHSHHPRTLSLQAYQSVSKERSPRNPILRYQPSLRQDGQSSQDARRTHDSQRIGALAGWRPPGDPVPAVHLVGSIQPPLPFAEQDLCVPRPKRLPADYPRRSRFRQADDLRRHFYKLSRLAYPLVRDPTLNMRSYKPGLRAPQCVTMSYRAPARIDLAVKERR